jgi:group II intron reverse transcriptase/maturase
VSSGCYFPPAVLEVGIPKDNGKTRYLGIPTVGDRIVQQVIKSILEPDLEDVFRDCSYGYRPGKRAHDALQQVRQNSRACYYAIDLDIAAFFDNVSHDLLNLALDRHVSEPWIRTLINRWLSAPIRKEDGSLSWRQGRGTPQGGVISPLLANLFLHYTLDVWLAEEFPTARMVRYADDVVIHCNHWGKVQLIRQRIEERLHRVGLSANADKTHVVFCKQSGRLGGTDHITLDFLGHRFQPRPTYSYAKRRLTTVFDCAISPKAEKKLRAKLRQLKFHLWHQEDLEDIARRLNPLTRGWINYYGKYRPERLRRIMRSLNDRLAKWLCRKYKRFGKSAKRAHRFLRNLARRLPSLFYHWQRGYFHA